MSEELWEEKDVITKEVTFYLEKDLIDAMIEIAKEKIVEDRRALLSYAVNLALKEVVRTNGQCLRDAIESSKTQ